MKKLILSIILAAVLWFVMFFPYLPIALNFWAVMTFSALLLTACALAFGGRPPLRLHWSEVALGVAIAVVLWGVFWLGDKCSQWLFDFARPQVDMIYGIKQGTPPALIALLLLLIIGPAEEIFWRGYVQRSITEHLSRHAQATGASDTVAFAHTTGASDTVAFTHTTGASATIAFALATAVYTLIHVASLNFMLTMAALVCGIVWGALYRLFPQHFTAIIISHALWDAAVFVWFPI